MAVVNTRMKDRCRAIRRGENGRYAVGWITAHRSDPTRDVFAIEGYADTLAQALDWLNGDYA